MAMPCSVSKKAPSGFPEGKCLQHGEDRELETPELLGNLARDAFGQDRSVPEASELEESFCPAPTVKAQMALLLAPLPILDG